MPTTNENIALKLTRLLREGRFLDAAHFYRDQSGVSRDEASGFIADLIQGIHVDKPDLFGHLKAKNKIPDDVEEAQEIALSTLGKPSKCLPKSKVSILEKLADYDADLIVFALGDLGRDFLRFRDSVNAGHPCLSRINSGTLVEGGKVFERLYESVVLAKFAKENKLCTMPLVIRDWLNRNHGRIRKVMQKPPASIYKSPASRKAARSIAKQKDINLSEVLERGRRTSWDGLPKSFVPFVRQGPGFRKEKERIGKMASEFKSLGMINQESAMLVSVSAMDDCISDQYCGFVRIKMTDAALIAAKTMRAEWNRVLGTRIAIPTSHFTVPVWLTNNTGDKMEDDPLLTDVYERHIQVEANYPQTGSSVISLTYAPRAYPLCHFTAEMPERASRLIEAVESHPDAAGGPLFDNLWVIVPSVHVNPKKGDHYEFFDGATHRKYYEYWEYCKALDTYLVETQQVFPLLLGEQVMLKKCYFLGYWA